MRTARLILLIVLGNTAWGANLAPGLQDWKPGGPGEATFRKQADDRATLGVRGGGEDSVAWLTADLKLDPGAAYIFRFSTMAQGSGTIISGLEGVNRDFAPPATWTTQGFAFRVPDGGGPTALRLGQWHLKGEALFNGVELYPVQVTHRRWGDLVLGEGERIDGGVYTDTHVLHWQGSTIHRTLYKQNAGFNSNRWCFGPGSEIIYRHALPEPMRSGEVRLNVNYHTGGTLTVSASKDGQNWTKTAEGPKVGGIEAKLPAELFPAKEIYIRLQAEGKNANLQVDSYAFRAQLEKAEVERAGKTILLEERQIAKGLRVQAEAAVTGDLRLHWWNTEETAREFEVEAGCRTAAAAGRSTCSVTIPPKGEGFCIVRFATQPGLPGGIA
ncbi:MAG: hypothetical protein NTW87_31635, partial [Planctomycetota bacterium]|nr:hypothetical protein [Planctomycetota bacterium]